MNYYKNISMKHKSTITILLLIFLLIISVSYNIKITSKLDSYESYMSERIGNLIRPTASNIVESQKVLKEVVTAGKINHIQYEELYIANSVFIGDMSEVRHFANRVINKDFKYNLSARFLNFDMFLRKIKFEGDFSDLEFDYDNPKEKILTKDELRKFKIMEKVINDYSNIFIEGLNYYYKTRESDNSLRLYNKQFDVSNKRWILVLEEICKYNFNSQYKDEF